MSNKVIPDPVDDTSLNPAWGEGRAIEPTSLAPSAMAIQLEELSTRAELIQLELERTHEQLEALHAMTSNAGALLSAKDPRDELMQTWGHALDAAAMVAIDAENVRMILVEGCLAPAPEIELDEIRQAFQAEIAALATDPEAKLVDLNKEQRRVVGGGYALIASPFSKTERPTIWITLRHWSQAPFDASDKAVAMSAITYGCLIQESSRMMQQLERSVMETVRALANAIDAKDRYTHGHSQRVSWLAKNFGKWLNFSPTETRVLEWAGLLHDVGKIGIPESILCKTGRLTDEEFSIIQQHPQMSYDVIAPVESLRAALPAVLHHHENFDGSGYPGNLYGYQTPLFARILRLVDVFDALTSPRSYRGGFSLDLARHVIVSDRKKASDPELTDEFIVALRDWVQESEHEFHGLFGHIDGLSDTECDHAEPPEEPELISIVQEPRI